MDMKLERDFTDFWKECFDGSELSIAFCYAVEEGRAD